MLMALRATPTLDRAFRSSRPSLWYSPLRQPVWRCVHHLICLLVRTVESSVHGTSYGGDLVLNRREVAAFKSQQGQGGRDERGQEVGKAQRRGAGHGAAAAAPAASRGAAAPAASRGS